jgi:hypothetical protein
MLKHPDIDVQALVEMLEGQRDNAMVQAAALFRENTELKQKLAKLSKEMANATDQVNDTQGAES